MRKEIVYRSFMRVGRPLSSSFKLLNANFDFSQTTKVQLGKGNKTKGQSKTPVPTKPVKSIVKQPSSVVSLKLSPVIILLFISFCINVNSAFEGFKEKHTQGTAVLAI